ncbi:MAG: sulfotransferase [Geminicoccales bacterium]
MGSPQKEFEVDWWVDRLGGHIERHSNFWIKAGNLETKILKDELAKAPIKTPIYVAGLARSGSTFLLEALAEHEDTATHRYKDFPPVFTPYWWNKFLSFMPKKEATPAERAHKDGIKITENSPEAFEETIWTAFFSNLHDPKTSALLDAKTSNPAFEQFYRDHIQKLLAVRHGKRYLSKGNYNLTRLAYLQKIFPDARFVLPLRAPAWHIASLIKQHRLFCKQLEGNPKAQAHMRRVGHFEFGPDRRAINANGDGSAIEAIQELWRQGKEIEGQARYWAYLHGKIADQLSANETLRDATLIVRYERLCDQPAETIKTLFNHCQLGLSEALLDNLASRVQHPTYYQPDFTDAERQVIDDITTPLVERFDALSYANASASKPTTTKGAALPLFSAG